ncbi:hypothetical protein COOONC_16936 [Cooperia oncophora]
MVRSQKLAVDSGTVAGWKTNAIRRKNLWNQTGLIKEAESRGFDKDSEVELVSNACEHKLVSNACEHKVFDASGNQMEFLAIVNAEISVEELIKFE